MSVTWAWSGRQTDSGFQVAFKLSAPASSCRLAVSTTNFGTPAFGATAVPDANNYVKVSKTGLTAGTLYYYRLEIDGSIDTAYTGECRTFPTAGQPASFTVAAATCSQDTSNSVVFDSIAARRPLVFLHGGDKHYGDIGTNTPASFRTIHDTTMSQAKQKAWHQVCPVDYVWDDHDFGGNGSDGTSAARPAANQVYRQLVPHYDLPAHRHGIWHHFDIGRVRVIATDLRSQRSPNAMADGRTKSMLGPEQRQWFFDLLQDAVDTGIRCVVWNNSSQWSIEENLGGADVTDCWRAFAYERALIARFMRRIGCPPVVIVSGDSHEIATRLDYQVGGMRFLVLQNAALDQSGNSRYGYWDHGPVTGGRHYGVLSFTDYGTSTLTLDYKAIEVSVGGVDSTLWNPVIDLEARRTKPVATHWHNARRLIGA